VALLEGAGIWHSIEVTPADAGKVVPLPWKMPFVAQWRADFTRPDGLVDSWAVLLQKQKGGGFTKPSWFESQILPIPPDRKRWTTVLGSFLYPCWSDPDLQAYLQPLDHPKLKFSGPTIIYPVHREKETPVDLYTVECIARASLGSTVCESIIDLAGNKQQFKGNTTCGVRDVLKPIYAQGQQKQNRAKIEKELDRGLLFVTHVRERIDAYLKFVVEMRAYLVEQQKAHPDCKGFFSDMEKIVQEFDGCVAARWEKIRTPSYVAELNEDFRKNGLDLEGPDAIAKCKKYTQALVEVGDNQDELVGECRWVAKTLRQKAGLLMATDPKVAPVAEAVRARTGQILRNSNAVERSEH